MAISAIMLKQHPNFHAWNGSQIPLVTGAAEALGLPDRAFSRPNIYANGMGNIISMGAIKFKTLKRLDCAVMARWSNASLAFTQIGHQCAEKLRGNLERWWLCFKELCLLQGANSYMVEFKRWMWMAKPEHCRICQMSPSNAWWLHFLLTHTWFLR